MTKPTDYSRQPLPGYQVEWGKAIAVERAEWLGAGDYCACYLVNSTYVFRFAKHPKASAALGVEQCLLPILQRHLPVTVPQPEFAGRCEGTGQGMIGYKILLGEPLEYDLLATLPQAIQAALIAQIANFARQLHNLPYQLVRHCSLPTLHPLTHLSTIMDKARRELAPYLEEPVWRYHENLLQRYASDPTLHTYQPAVLHGDLSPDHVLADIAQAKLTGVIDFGDTCIGDPAWDLIYIREDYGANILNTLLNHYDPVNAQLIAHKVQIYQQLNNVGYCLNTQSSGDTAQFQEAIAILEEQAAAGKA